MTIQRIQPVTAPSGQNAVFVVLGINNTTDALEKVKDFASSFTALIRSINKRFPNMHFNAIMGFGSDAWDKLFPNQEKPKELSPFQAIKGTKHTAVATPGDLFFHIRADQPDICFELTSLIDRQLQEATYPIDETHGFHYLDGRAIIGFVDGTENPEDIEAKEYALIGKEDQEFQGGSYAFVQKYLHNMNTWRSLSDEEQAGVIGRRKFDDVELDDDIKPKNAHNNVSKAHDKEGNELKIVRANVAFAQPSKKEYGTYFIGYARHFSVTQQMLTHMFAGNEEGYTDRLLDFSTPQTGTLFFIPTYDFLDDISND